MQLVIQSLLKAIKQLSDRRIMKVLAKSLGITLAIFAAWAVLLWWPFEMWFQNSIVPILPDWVEGGPAAAVLLFFVWAVSFWLFFRIVALAVLQFFADEIVAAVEDAYYDEHGQALPFKQDMANSFKGMGRAVLYNALALPLAIILLFTAVGPGLLFILVNAVLLGRELTDMCWLRLCPVTGESAQTPVSGLERLLLGASVAGLMLIPLLNLLAPVIGAAAGTHLVHMKRAQAGKGRS